MANRPFKMSFFKFQTVPRTLKNFFLISHAVQSGSAVLLKYRALTCLDAPVSSLYSLMVIGSRSLTSLGLRSLRHINDGGVYIKGNKKLCYLDTVNWTRIIGSSTRRGQKNVEVKDNRPVKQCGESVWVFLESVRVAVMAFILIVCFYFLLAFAVEEGHVCDPLCANGCWGPGTNQCLSCKNYSRGGACVSDCLFFTG